MKNIIPFIPLLGIILMNPKVYDKIIGYDPFDYPLLNDNIFWWSIAVQTISGVSVVLWIFYKLII